MKDNKINNKKNDKKVKKDNAVESEVYYDPDGLKETPENPLITKIKNIKDSWKDGLQR